MRIQDGDMTSDSARTAIDRHAVTAAGQLLMSAIWLEHRVRRFSTGLRMLPSQPVPAVGATERHLTKRKVRPNDYVREGR